MPLMPVASVVAAAVVGYGTSLPASPVDGQLYVLVDSLTVPTYQWTFRYNAGSSNADKWEFVGGGPAVVEVKTLETIITLGAVAADLATVGPRVTGLRNGVYSVVGITTSYGNGVDNLYIGISLGAAVFTGGNARWTFRGTAGDSAQQSIGLLITGVTGGELRLRYAGNVAGHQWGQRTITVTPIRVS